MTLALRLSMQNKTASKSAATSAVALPVEVQCSAARLWEALHAAKCQDAAAWDALATILAAASQHAYYQDRATDARRMARYHANAPVIPVF